MGGWGATVVKTKRGEEDRETRDVCERYERMCVKGMFETCVAAPCIMSRRGRGLNKYQLRALLTSLARRQRVCVLRAHSGQQAQYDTALD